jgi:hypothetical protein
MKYMNPSRRSSPDTAWPLVRADGRPWEPRPNRRTYRRIIPLEVVPEPRRWPTMLAIVAMFAMLLIVANGDLIVQILGE